MNDRNTILKIIRHPLIKQIMENKMATTSIVTKLIAEELRFGGIYEQEQQDSIKQLLEVIEKYKPVFDLLNDSLTDEIKNNAEELIELADLLNQVNEAQTKVHDKQAKAYFQKKEWNKAAQEILLGIDKTLKNIQSSVGQVQKQPNKAESLYNQLKTFVKFYQYAVSLKQFAAEQPADKVHECIQLLGELIKEIILRSQKSKDEFAKDSASFLKYLPMKKTDPGHDKLKKQILPVFKEYSFVLNKQLKSIQKFANLAGNDQECNQAFIKLKEKDQQVFVIGRFLIEYQRFLQKIDPKKAPEEKADINKMVDAMKRTNKLATEKEDVYWSVDGGFTQVFEVAYLPKGSETANNGTQEKPLTDYNISPEALKVGDKGSILIVRSEQLYKVEKIVQEQEGKRITVSIPIKNVKQYNALFSGTEDENGMPTGEGAFFVHSEQEKMVPLKTEEPPEEEEEEEEEQDPIKEEDVKFYIEKFQKFLKDFMKVRTLKRQSDIFYDFHQAVLRLTGKPTDEIVGDQLAALTKTAQNLQEEEPKTFKKSAVKGETKDILTGAMVTQRHVEAIQQALEEYKKYLGKPGGSEGVTVGSRELFDKFGEGDPKKVLYKFVKLLVKDINSMVSKMQAIEKKLEDSVKQQGSKDQLAEEKEKIDLREKIRMVEKVYMYVKQYGKELENAISKFAEKSNTDKKEEEPPQEPVQEQEEVGGEQIAGDDISKIDQTAADPQTVGARKTRDNKEVYGNYKKIALDIDEQLETIALFFPTARPFDSKYTMQRAQKSFLTVTKRLGIVVANVQGFLRDEDINVPTLNDLTEQLLAIKNVMKDIFGLSDDQQGTEKVAAINDEGAESGLPEPKTDEPEDTSTPKDLPTQVKDFLGQYQGKYDRVKAILDRGLFKEGISDEYEQLKAAFLQADKMVGYVSKDYGSMLKAAKAQGIPSKETKTLVGDLLRKFVSLYEELTDLYKRATENPSMWKKMWKNITNKFSELKSSMNKIYKTIFGPLDINLDLSPEDFKMPGQDMFGMPEQDKKEVAEIFTKKLGEEEDPAEFWNKPLEQQVSFVLDIAPEPFKVKYFDAKPISEPENKKDYETLMDYLEEETQIRTKSDEFDTMVKLEKSFVKNRVIAQIFKFYGDPKPEPKIKQSLALLTYVYLNSTIVADNRVTEVYYDKIPKKDRPDRTKFDKTVSKLTKKEKALLASFHKDTPSDKVIRVYGLLRNVFGGTKLSMTRRLVSKDMYGIFLNSDEMNSLGLTGDETTVMGIEKEVQGVDVSREIQVFKKMYKPSEGDIPFSGDIEKFAEMTLKFFKKEFENIKENVGDLKRAIPADLRGALDNALDNAEEALGTRAYQKFSGFLGQTSVAPISSKKQKSNRKKNNAMKSFAYALKRISAVDKGAKRDKKNKEPRAEQISNKLKPLIREMLFKGNKNEKKS
jgi:hypothetical protein